MSVTLSYILEFQKKWIWIIQLTDTKSKHSMSIFIGTDFERMIRNAGITTIIFIGISTEGGIESSARDALNRDFYPVIVSDAVSSSDKDAHTRSLHNMERFLTVISSNELASI